MFSQQLPVLDPAQPHCSVVQKLCTSTRALATCSLTIRKSASKRMRFSTVILVVGALASFSAHSYVSMESER